MCVHHPLMALSPPLESLAFLGVFLIYYHLLDLILCWCSSAWPSSCAEFGHEVASFASNEERFCAWKARYSYWWHLAWPGTGCYSSSDEKGASHALRCSFVPVQILFIELKF
jgi:hypothetical protein